MRKRLTLEETFDNWSRREIERDEYPLNSYKAFLLGVATGRRWEKQEQTKQLSTKGENNA